MSGLRKLKFLVRWDVGNLLKICVKLSVLLVYEIVYFILFAQSFADLQVCKDAIDCCLIDSWI